jgi:probable HAF family extracellular repeat protein
VYTSIHVPGKTAMATGINNNGDIVGFSTGSAGKHFSWLLKDGHLTTFGFPGILGGSHTQALGINDKDQIVGSYVDSSKKMHGFVLSDPTGPTSHWQTIDDTSPSAMPGTTVVNGINDAGDLVGFYTDTAGNVDGMLAEMNKAYLQLQSMPSGTASFGTDSSGSLKGQTVYRPSRRAALS